MQLDYEDLPPAGTDSRFFALCGYVTLKTEKPNYLDSVCDTKSGLGSTHVNGIESIGFIHGEIKTTRHFFQGPANVCCQRRRFF